MNTPSSSLLQFGIQRVVIGENTNFAGNIDFLRESGVVVVVLNDQGCIELMAKFITERPELWCEDISGNA